MTDKKLSNYVITIGRQFGSGGRELGKLLAERLGIAYYDKELLLEAAKSKGLSPEYFERNDERFPRFYTGIMPFNLGYNATNWYSNSNVISDENIYNAQSEFINDIAQRSSCIIVGRSADYVLRDRPNVIKIFVHAPINARVKRILKRGDCQDAHKAKALAEKTDKLRANYYNFYTDKRWGDAASYDLTFNSAILPMTQMADIIADYVKQRINAD